MDNYANDTIKETAIENEKSAKKSRIIIIGDSLLNSINEKGLSKINAVKIKSFPGGTTETILEEVEKQGISHEGYQSRTNVIRLLCMLGPMI